METLKGLAEKYAQRDDLYTEDGEYTKTTVINAFNDGAKAMLQVIGFSLAAHRHKETKVTTKKEREWLIEQINKTNMEVKELRVGNIVEVNHFEYGDMYASVTSINDVGDLCLHLLDERFTKEEYECTMNEVYPITLTDNILVKLGFVERELNSIEQVYYNRQYGCVGRLVFKDYCTLINIDKHTVLNNEPVETVFMNEMCLEGRIHIHTLQNIWHLLTGKELEIEL